MPKSDRSDLSCEGVGPRNCNTCAMFGVRSNTSRQEERMGISEGRGGIYLIFPLHHQGNAAPVLYRTLRGERVWVNF